MSNPDFNKFVKKELEEITKEIDFSNGINPNSEQQFDEAKKTKKVLNKEGIVSQKVTKRRGRKPATENGIYNKKKILKLETKNYTLSRIPHLALPNFNLNLKGTSVNKIAEPLLFKCNEPEAVRVSVNQPNKVDICHKRTIAYAEYNLAISKNQSAFVLAEKKKYIKKHFKKNIYPHTAVKFAEILENNPDPFFNGCYDWYFTGGNLFYDNDQNFLASAAGNNLQEFVISRFKKRNRKQFLKQMSKIDYSDLLNNELDPDYKFIEILETQKIKSLKNRYLIRQKNAVSICTYDENNLLIDIVIPNSDINQSAPFITATSHLYQPEIILTGNLNKTVHLWNLKQSIKIPNKSLLKFTSDEDNWNCLRNYDQNMFAFATSRDFYLLDIRLPPEEINRNKLCLKAKLHECENITAMQISDFSNCIYFGSTHKIFSIDPRYMLNDSINDANSFVQCWSHQMKLPPIILKSYSFVENYDVVVASSSLSGDLRLIENTRKLKNDKERLLSYCLPYMPPSLTHAYQNAKNLGECLDPTTNLDSRIKSSICGLDFFKRGSNLYIVFSNSLGDIFTQQLIFENDERETKNIESIKKYNDNIKINLIDMPQVVTATDVKDLSGVKKILRCSHLDNQYQDDNEIVSDVHELKRQIKIPKWQRSIKQLSKYKDVLAQDLLAIWEIERESDEEICDVKTHLKKIKHEKNLDVSIKVGNWLDNTIIDNNDTQPFDLDFTANNVFSSTQVSHVQPKYEEDDTLQNTIELENSKLNFNTVIHSTLTSRKLTEDDLINYSFLNNTNIKEECIAPNVSSVKTKKPKKTHVVGF